MSPTSKRIKAPKTSGGKNVPHLDADEWFRFYHDAVRRRQTMWIATYIKPCDKHYYE